MRELFYHPKQNDDLCDSEDNNDDLEQVDVPSTGNGHNHNHGKLHHHHHNDNALLKAWGADDAEEEFANHRLETLESPEKVGNASNLKLNVGLGWWEQ